ncbi:hypothetical protein TGRH88_006270 [Toxoplasma gondii]|uniref:Uncharacterized protein n=1 Tax=Toxoplasma gondii TaxID=5811 RepID=A0A7J6KE35_TOXGO|nr:hypothetical protein TGRH88_006220 [Toxoplasma gondii]KAF4645188.1 hypothetical protein TGRH88_006230 [Toxoplasma gondii]KAF4645189.1 hypothetical protein TGRH88_006240 [Toxoplasma gondii]KAF4645190.1 hypothetical protein TGRH88_006250 [Toxoplasma gondii]KAF4645191.1 hypothetical protein TGRH88_006260 [Toxoplasma gondii]
MIDVYHSSALPTPAWSVPGFVPSAVIGEAHCSWSPRHRWNDVNRKHAPNTITAGCIDF